MQDSYSVIINELLGSKYVSTTNNPDDSQTILTRGPNSLELRAAKIIYQLLQENEKLKQTQHPSN